MFNLDQGSIDCIHRDGLHSGVGEGCGTGMGDGCARDDRSTGRWWGDRSIGLRHDS